MKVFWLVCLVKAQFRLQTWKKMTKQQLQGRFQIVDENGRELYFTDYDPESARDQERLFGLVTRVIGLDEPDAKTQKAMEAMAKQYGAPDYAKIESFFVNMRLKHQETFQ